MRRQLIIVSMGLLIFPEMDIEFENFNMKNQLPPWLDRIAFNPHTNARLNEMNSFVIINQNKLYVPSLCNNVKEDYSIFISISLETMVSFNFRVIFETLHKTPLFNLFLQNLRWRYVENPAVHIPNHSNHFWLGFLSSTTKTLIYLNFSWF